MATAVLRHSPQPQPVPRRPPTTVTSYQERTETAYPEPSRDPSSLAGIANIATTDLIASLQRVLWQSEGLLRAPLAEEQQLGVHSISTNLNRVLSIARKLQQLAVMETALWGTVDCEAVLRNVCDDLREAIHDTGARVLWDDLPSVHGREAALETTFRELIANAINYRSADEPLIQVEAHRHLDGWRFSVSDNGIGFDQRHGRKIFEPFYTVDPRSSRPGFGLTAARAAVNSLGGDIWAEGNAGGGATFFFTIPARVISGS